MAANIIRATFACPRCGGTHEHAIESTLDGQGFASPDYRIGDRINWLPTREPEEGGRPLNGDLDTDGYAVCDVCGKDFFVRVEVRNDQLVKVEVDPSKPGYDQP